MWRTWKARTERDKTRTCRASRAGVVAALVVSVVLHAGLAWSLPSSFPTYSALQIHLINFELIYIEKSVFKETLREISQQARSSTRLLLPKKTEPRIFHNSSRKALSGWPYSDPIKAAPTTQTIIPSTPLLPGPTETITNEKGSVLTNEVAVTVTTPTVGRPITVSLTTVPGASRASPRGDTDIAIEIARRLRFSATECYPYSAIKLNLEGTVGIRFCVDNRGNPRDAKITKSSGFSFFDDAAIECVLENAAPFPRTPRCLSVPIRFKLRR
jgi:TonB family protein